MSERIDIVRAGYFRRKLVRGGIWVGVRFWLDDEQQWRVEVNGNTHRIISKDNGEPAHIEPLDVYHEWAACCGQQITEREFQFLMRRREWARTHAPDHPAAQPHQPVDLSKLPPRY